MNSVYEDDGETIAHNTEWTEIFPQKQEPASTEHSLVMSATHEEAPNTTDSILVPSKVIRYASGTVTVKLVAWAEHIRDMGKYTVGDGANGRGTLYGCEGISGPPHNTIILVRTNHGEMETQ